MLSDRDRIFLNLYGQGDWGLKGARARGAWDGTKGFIRRSDLARDRADQRPDRFGVGEKVDALVTAVDKASRKLTLSVKARELAEEKEAVAQFGSSDSGASLGDILGAALKKHRDTEDGGEEE